MEGRIHCSMTLQFATALAILLSGINFARSETVELFPFLSTTYYLHDNFIPPDVTAVKVASASGNISSNEQAFGDVSVFDSILKSGVARDSPVIGAASGQISSLRNGLSFITFVHDLTILHYSGTITASARFNVSSPSWEIGISTGSGSFRGATGYYTVSVADPNPLGFVVKYEATISSPSFSTRRPLFLPLLPPSLRHNFLPLGLKL